MTKITDKQKARGFMDSLEGTPLTMTQRVEGGDTEFEITIAPTDDLIMVARAAEDQGFALKWDGQRVLVVAAPSEPLPVEVTPDPEKEKKP